MEQARETVAARIRRYPRESCAKGLAGMLAELDRGSRTAREDPRPRKPARRGENAKRDGADDFHTLRSPRRASTRSASRFAPTVITVSNKVTATRTGRSRPRAARHGELPNARDVRDRLDRDGSAEGEGDGDPG